LRGQDGLQSHPFNKTQHRASVELTRASRITRSAPLASIRRVREEGALSPQELKRQLLTVPAGRTCVTQTKSEHRIRFARDNGTSFGRCEGLSD
jgi:hypothetical protein